VKEPMTSLKQECEMLTITHKQQVIDLVIKTWHVAYEAGARDAYQIALSLLKKDEKVVDNYPPAA
jgi:hypothetical protein